MLTSPPHEKPNKTFKRYILLHQLRDLYNKKNSVTTNLSRIIINIFIASQLYYCI